MTKLSLVTLLVIVCLQLLGCRQSRPPDTPVASHTQQAIVTPIPTYTPIAQSVTQQRNSQSVVPEADVSKARATPTTEIVPVPTSPTATATATRQPTATATRQPTATPTPEYYVTGSANLRSGPGTNYDIVGGRQPNDVLSPIARTADGEWIQVDDNIWIWSGLVEGDVEKLSVTLTPVPTATHPPSPTFTPTPQVQVQVKSTPTLTIQELQEQLFYCVSDNELNYIKKIQAHINIVYATMNLTDTVIDALREDYNRIGNPVWISSKNRAIGYLYDLLQDFSIAPIQEHWDFHYQYRDTLELFVESAYMLDRGFTSRSRTVINQGIELLSSAQRSLHRDLIYLAFICD